MTRAFKIVLTVFVVILEMTILAHFKFFGVLPNYMFALMLAFAAIEADRECVAFSCGAGLLADVLSGSLLGLNALAAMYLTIFFIALSDVFYIKKLRLMLPLGFVTLFFYELLFGAAASIVRGAEAKMTYLVKTALLGAFISTIVFIVFYQILKRVKLQKRKRGIRYERQI